MRNWTFSRPSIPMILRAFTCPGSCADPSNKLFKSRLLTGEISKRHRPLSKSEVGCQRGANLNVQAKHQFGYRAWIRTMNNASKGGWVTVQHAGKVSRTKLEKNAKTQAEIGEETAGIADIAASAGNGKRRTRRFLPPPKTVRHFLSNEWPVISEGFSK